MSDEAKGTNDELTFHKVETDDQFPEWAPREKVAMYLHTTMDPFNDSLEDVNRGLDYAFGKEGAPGGWVMLARLNGELVGVLVMLKTGMHGFIPDNILLYVTVDPSTRGKGIGGKLINHCLEVADGDVKLHVEYDNPAKRLYERLGFTSKYAEMRYEK